jgi:hypothetical protein
MAITLTMNSIDVCMYLLCTRAFVNTIVYIAPAQCWSWALCTEGETKQATVNQHPPAHHALDAFYNLQPVLGMCLLVENCSLTFTYEVLY